MAIPKTGTLANILADLNKDGKSGSVQYLKDGDTSIKLVIPNGRTLETFYERFTSMYQGTPNVSYLVAAVITEADEEGVSDVTKIRYVRVTKTVLLEVVNLLSKKWKLFDDDGNIVVITRGKKGGKTAYSVAAIPDTFNHLKVEVSDPNNKGQTIFIAATFPTESINEAARSQEEMSANLDAESNKGEELK